MILGKVDISSVVLTPAFFNRLSDVPAWCPEINISSLAINTYYAEIPLVLKRFKDLVFCGCAAPHIDEDFDGEVFLGICVRGAHSIGSVACENMNEYERENVLTPGTVFVVEPMQMHWLTSCGWEDANTFLCMQSILPREENMRLFKRLRNSAGLNFEKHSRVEKRYEHWFTD